MAQMDLINEIKQGSRWANKDAFPSTQEWAMEVDKWLAFLKEEKQFDRFLPRLKDAPKKRDETLSEISAAYFISKIKCCHIAEWEPRGEENQIGEFAFNVPDTTVFCEIKSPGWESEIAKKDKGSPRLKQPKYINAEERFYNNARDIRNSVEKAYPKFKIDTPNLLIIVDDLFVSLNDDMFGAKEALYYEQLKPPYTDTKPNSCFANKDFERLSALATLNIQQSKQIEYHWKLFKNGFALCEIPGAFINERSVYEIAVI